MGSHFVGMQIQGAWSLQSRFRHAEGRTGPDVTGKHKVRPKATQLRHCVEVERDEARLLRIEGKACTCDIEAGRLIPVVRTGLLTRHHAGLESRHVLYEAMQQELDTTR